MKQYNFRIDDHMIAEAEDIAKIYDESVSDLIREGLALLIEERKKDFLYRFKHNVKEASLSETNEIMNELNNMSSEELEIVRTEAVKIDKWSNL